MAGILDKQMLYLDRMIWTTASGYKVSGYDIKDDNLEFLASVYASTRAEELTVVTHWNQEEKDAFLRHQFEAQHKYYHEQFPACRFLVLEDDQNKKLGRLYIDERVDEIRIVDIALLPQFRGKGIGSTIMKSIIEHADSIRKHVRIHVERNNRALSLYQRLGFRAIEDKGVYLLMEHSCQI